MLARIRKNVEEKDQGFTLIELLVVIIIIGILAAIAIPTFLSQREKGWASQVESDVKNASIAAESYATEHNGSYAGMTLPLLDSDQGFNPTDDVNLAVTLGAGNNSYTIAGTHDNMAGTWTYNSSTGVITKTP